MVVLEAMAKGLPVICLDYGGPGEYVDDSCGIKVPVTDPQKVIDGLADAIYNIATDPQLYETLSEGAIERIKRHFTWDKIGEKIKKVYEQVLAETAGGAY